MKNIFFHVFGLVTIRDQRNTGTDKLTHTMTKVVSDSAGIRNTKLELLVLNIKYLSVNIVSHEDKITKIMSQIQPEIQGYL